MNLSSDIVNTRSDRIAIDNERIANETSLTNKLNLLNYEKDRLNNEIKSKIEYISQLVSERNSIAEKLNIETSNRVTSEGLNIELKKELDSAKHTHAYETDKTAIDIESATKARDDMSIQ